MAELKGTRTEANLQTAFAGESMARSKYTFFASKAKKDGYVKTMLNRIRYIPELKSPNYNIRQFGERVALNTPIQGTAADIIKLAMVRVDNRLINEGLKSKLILQVHDELIVEAHKDEVDKVKQILSEEMQSAMELNVPLKVDMSTGHSGYDAK